MTTHTAATTPTPTPTVTTGLFSDLGWVIIPLAHTGKGLYRDTTQPLHPKKGIDWNKTGSYRHLLQTYTHVDVPLGALVSGVTSNVMALDCDNQLTYDKLLQLLSYPEFVFPSRNKPSGGGTIIVTYDPTVPHMQIHTSDSPYEIDVQTDNRLVFLPTTLNTTKEPWNYHSLNTFPAINPLTKAAKEFLSTLSPTPTLSPPPSHLQHPFEKNIFPKNNLVKEFLSDSPNAAKNLLAVIAPNTSITDLPSTGGRSNFLAKVISPKLGSDNSIDKDMYISAMAKINNLLPSPLTLTALTSTITSPMIGLKASVNNKPIWKYDSQWSSAHFYYVTREGEEGIAFRDKLSDLFHMLESTPLALLRTYSSVKALTDSLNYNTNKTYTITSVAKAVTNIEVVNIPTSPHGFTHTATTSTYNTCKRSIPLEIIADPTLYLHRYHTTRTAPRYPTTILKFLAYIAQDKSLLDYTLMFWRHKLVTYEYSPVVFYLIGIQGSGKSTFAELFKDFVGPDNSTDLGRDNFDDKFKHSLSAKLVSALEEHGGSGKQERMNTLKSLTGKTLTTRPMYRDTVKSPNYLTFIMTGNEHSINIDSNDRRLVMFRVDTKLERQQWVIDLGGTAALMHDIEDTMDDFAYYLATTTPKFPDIDLYTNPPSTLLKSEMILEELNFLEELFHHLVSDNPSKLLEITKKYAFPELLAHTNMRRIYMEDVDDLVCLATGIKSNIRWVRRIARESGFKVHQGTRDTLPVTFITLENGIANRFN